MLVEGGVTCCLGLLVGFLACGLTLYEGLLTFCLLSLALLLLADACLFVGDALLFSGIAVDLCCCACVLSIGAEGFSRIYCWI